MTLADERRIAEAATEGPWEERTDDADMLHVVHDSEYVSYVCTVGGKEAPNAESDAEFIATFNPQRVLELLDENERLSQRVTRLSNLERRNAKQRDSARARLAAVEEMHVPPPGLGPAYCTECDQLHPCDTTKAARGE